MNGKPPFAPRFMLGLAVVGIADAFYVAQASYTGRVLWCPIIDGCNAVAQSPYARIAGVPLSYLGLMFYLYMVGVAALLAYDPYSRGLRLGAVTYAALGVAYSMYGMYLQLSVIRAVCVYCFVSAVITVLLLVGAGRHLVLTRGPVMARSPGADGSAPREIGRLA